MLQLKPNGLIDCPSCGKEVEITDLTWPKYTVTELADHRPTHGGPPRCIHCLPPIAPASPVAPASPPVKETPLESLLSRISLSSGLLQNAQGYINALPEPLAAEVIRALGPVENGLHFARKCLLKYRQLSPQPVSEPNPKPQTLNPMVSP